MVRLSVSDHTFWPWPSIFKDRFIMFGSFVFFSQVFYSVRFSVSILAIKCIGYITE
jgi:hypothetical protein